MPNEAQSAGELVRNTIERDPVVRFGLTRRLVNHRALARTIQAESAADVSFDAILSAIRRYPLRRAYERHEKAGKMISKIGMKNRVVVLSLKNDRETQRAIARFSEEVNYSAGETFRVISSMDYVSVTLDARNSDVFETRLPKSVIRKKTGGLAELTIEMEVEVEESPGALAVVVGELALNEVNIRQLTSVGPGRVIVLVNERDALKSYQALEILAKEG
ncbi:MAG: hypothetical protein JRN28_00145 [Nitrososphaerota archaeon]|nr:hypothetical protein [Nitrososphaerota archaeon]